MDFRPSGQRNTFELLSGHLPEGHCSIRTPIYSPKFIISVQFDLCSQDTFHLSTAFNPVILSLAVFGVGESTGGYTLPARDLPMWDK
jgi:hypothetical protein